MIDLDLPIPYMQRTRDWYLALGYDNPYAWARYDDVSFARLAGPVAGARVALVTTASPFQPDRGPQGPGAPYNAATKFYAVYSGDTAADHDLRIAHVAIDRQHASLADDGCWFPLAALRRAVAQRRIGSLAPRFHGLPTDRSQRRTLEVYAPEILARCRADRADAAILVGNCPVCHQSVSLVARHLEQNGIATVVVGAARDVVEHCGVPRFVFSDFPLGNAAGRPDDLASQDFTMALAIRALDEAVAPRTTIVSALRWPADPTWKLDYANPDRLGTEELARLRQENEHARLQARAIKVSAGGATDGG